MKNPAKSSFLVALALGAAACGDDDARGPGDTATSTTDTATTSGTDASATGDTSTDDTATPGDDATTATGTDATSTTDTTADGDTSDVPPPVLASERYGARMWGPIIGLSITPTESGGRYLWAGQRGNPDYMSESETPPILGGLVRLDLTSGEAKVFRDELGTEEYAFAGYPGLFGPVATAGVHQDGDRVVVVSHAGLLAIEGDDVTPFTVHLPNDGPAVVPVNLAIARDGLRPVAWMTSDQGLLRLDEDTFVVEDVTTAAEVGLDGDFGKLAVDPDTGTVFATFFPDDASPTRLVSVTVTGTLTVLVPGTGGLPSGRVGDIVWSTADQGVYVALAAWNANQGGVLFWDGVATTPGAGARALVDEGDLGNGEAFGAQVLALDEEHRVLAVGANMLGNPIGSPKGGGLAWVRLPEAAGGAVEIVSTEQKGVATPFVAVHVQTMTWDPATRRLYAAIFDICSETRLRSRGLFALYFDAEGILRFERPLLSSVRALGLFDDTLYVGMRDDNGGLACDGFPMTSGLAKPTAGGVGALNLLVPQGADLIVPDAGVTAIAGTSERSFALGTFRDGFYVGSLGGGIVGNPAFIGPSLLTEDVLWDAASSTLWLAGGTTHNNGDPAILADRGPRGAAAVVMGPEGPTTVTHYVRATDFGGPIAGLPTGEVLDLLWDPDGGVVMACATERIHVSDFDRSENPPFLVDGEPRLGGIAHVDGETITVLAGPELVPDPRAIAWGGDGKLLVADAEVGLVRLDGAAATPIATPGLPAGAVPHVLWADGDDLALGTSKGLWLRWHGATKVYDDVGFVWSVQPKGDHLVVGTDEGLLIIREATTAPLELPAAAEGHGPPFASDGD